jgi:hypothetical protein
MTRLSDSSAAFHVKWLRVAACAASVGLVLIGRPHLEARDVPARLDDKTFWQMVSGFSEPGGRFPSDNFVSNEIQYQTVLPRLTKAIAPGGVYIGVGPDQNFTYIVGLKPRLAFIIDIRRQNLLHHLLYKAVVELSPTREAFLARLFGRPPPARAGATASPGPLFDALAAAPPPAPGHFDRLVQDVLDRLQKHHGFTLSEGDAQTIRYIYDAFASSGPDISYASSAGIVVSLGGRLFRNPASPYPTYAEIHTRHDGTGLNRSYLGTEASYKALRDMHLRNAIIPIVGDFAGTSAIRSVAAYLRERKARVTTFYTSNVEQYLFQNHLWREFYDNVATLPLDATSTFIRSEFLNQPMPWISTTPNGDSVTSHRALRASDTLTCSIQELLAAVASGRIVTYREVIEMSRY